MTALFLVALVAGLLTIVRAMFFGVERRRRGGAGTARRSEPLAAAFVLVFGIVGYVATRPERMTLAGGTALAAACGAVAALLAWRLVAALERVVPEHDPDDPRFALQGHPARVVVAIGADGEGEIAYDERGTRHTMRARGLDGAAIAAGSEVVIERLDDGVAWVEAWATVEQRL